jgi:NADH:ubiquinone oxidoreductase subunit 6 (subunit J)
MEGIYWPSVFFLLFATIACVFALAVVFTANIVRMAFYLVISLGATAGLFFLAGADFVGAMQLMIYVGGTLVLLIFGVMLTAQGPFITMKTPAGQWILAAIVGGGLLYILLLTAFDIPAWQPIDRATAEAADAPKTATRIGMDLVGVRTDKLQQPDETLQKGMSSYLLPFEIISVHLLVVLVGAAYLARTKRRRDRAPSEV